MDKEILKQVIVDNQIEISNYKIIKRDFTFEEFGNYVFVGIRRAEKTIKINDQTIEVIPVWKWLLNTPHSTMLGFHIARCEQFTSLDVKLSHRPM